MESIEEKVNKSIEEMEHRFSGNDKLREFENTNKIFEELVEKGLIKRRGNNLLSATDAHIKTKALFNI